MSFAWRAWRSQAPSSSMPTQGAARKRILEESCPACLHRKSNSRARFRSKKTTASPTAMPFFVPPKQSTSTPACQVISLGVQASEATAFANRAPSMWMRRSCDLARAQMAFSSSGV